PHQRRRAGAHRLERARLGPGRAQRAGARPRRHPVRHAGPAARHGAHASGRPALARAHARTMTARTFVVADIHGELHALQPLLERLPRLTAHDTLVFLGDYIDRGPDSAGVVERVREIQDAGPCKVIALRGNHEDSWTESYRVPNAGFLMPRGNGCTEMYRSFT